MISTVLTRTVEEKQCKKILKFSAVGACSRFELPDLGLCIEVIIGDNGAGFCINLSDNEYKVRGSKMPVKRSVTKSQDIDQVQILKDELEHYQDKLQSTYEKSINSLKKKIDRLKLNAAKVKEKLRKSKEKLPAAKAQYKTKPTKTNEARLEKTQAFCESAKSSLDEERTALTDAKAYFAELVQGYKAYKAQQKVLKKFENEWSKQVKPKEKLALKRSGSKQPKRKKQKTAVNRSELYKVDGQASDQAALGLEEELSDQGNLYTPNTE